MGSGQELYKHAKKVIPGGTQLLSKRPEQFLPELWPAYYSKAKGCKIWDMDGNEYTDVSYMGIGANIIGYAVSEIDSAVKEVIDCGQMATLNAPEEVYLADALLALHPWANMVRYAKSGGEAMAVAVRIARAYTKKDIVLFCGYHGWHDWYLAANIAEKDALSYNHLAGLEPAGVPKGLAGTNIPFHYNNIEEFCALMKEHEGKIAAVVMEPIRNDYPEDNFLEKIREMTTQNKIALVFDEVTAGFRLNNGGSHLALGITPDMAVFGKGLANGYPITAIIGKENIMSCAQDTFISSTFFTERTGFAGALATLDFYAEHSVDKHLSKIGNMVMAGWELAAQKCGIAIKTGGIPPLGHFAFTEYEPLVAKTFFTQEMLKKGYLATTAFYVSYAHKEEDIRKYLAATEEVFGKMAETKDIRAALEGPVCHAGFQRLI